MNRSIIKYTELQESLGAAVAIGTGLGLGGLEALGYLKQRKSYKRLKKSQLKNYSGYIKSLNKDTNNPENDKDIEDSYREVQKERVNYDEASNTRPSRLVIRALGGDTRGHLQRRIIDDKEHDANGKALAKKLKYKPVPRNITGNIYKTPYE